MSERVRREHLLFYIQATTFNGADESLDSVSLPVRFSSRAHAEHFMRAYLEHSFADGRCGYDTDRACWWGCARESHRMLERFTINYRDGVAAGDVSPKFA